jgi:hypothetical protein
MMRLAILPCILFAVATASTTPVSCFTSGCAIGQSVGVIAGPAPVRQAPATNGRFGPQLGLEPTGAVGKIVSAPIQSNKKDFSWVLVNFGTGVCTAKSVAALLPKASSTPHHIKTFDTVKKNVAPCGYVGNDNLAPLGGVETGKEKP